MGERPLTAQQLSDALGCFWNAAIGEARNQQDGMAFAAIMAEGMAAVQHRLSEIAGEQERAALASQAAEIARLREALKPFAEEARRYEPPEDDDAEPAFDSQFTYGELRRARAALNGEKP